MLSNNDVHPFHQLLISLMLGLLVGLQRQWATSSLGGVRTFALTSLFGTICAFLAERFSGWILVAGLMGIAAAIIVENLRQRVIPENKGTGISAEVALLLMFSVGALVRTGPIWLAAATAAVTAFTLQAKLELHELASRFTAKEIKAIMQFALISLVVLPIVPDQTLDPLGVVNPRNVWLMVVLIVGLGLAGYIVYKFFGQNAGILLSGILGGVISSTATTASYSKAIPASGVAGVSYSSTIIAIAWTTLYVRLFFETLVVAPEFRALWLPLGILFAVSAATTLLLWKRSDSVRTQMPEQQNPSEMRTALVFGIIYSLVIFGAAFAREKWGSHGLLTMAVLSGITDMDAITLSTAKLVHANKMTATEGAPVIITAAISNVFFKGVIAGMWGGRRMFFGLILPWGLSLICGVFLLLFWKY